jgi:hypothetical protein
VRLSWVIVALVTAFFPAGCGGNGDEGEAANGERLADAGGGACQLLSGDEFGATVGNPISRAFPFGGPWTCSYETEEITDVDGVVSLLPLGPGLSWEETCDLGQGVELDVPTPDRQPIDRTGLLVSVGVGLTACQEAITHLRRSSTLYRRNRSRFRHPFLAHGQEAIPDPLHRRFQGARRGSASSCPTTAPRRRRAPRPAPRHPHRAPPRQPARSGQRPAGRRLIPAPLRLRP